MATCQDTGEPTRVPRCLRRTFGIMATRTPKKRIEGAGEAVDLVSLDPRQARDDAGGTAQDEGIRVRP
ncbi:hypothetical protein GCM10020001_071470 [Nonomuraea salmonea]